MKLNIGTKQIGDLLTAEEFNELVSSINNFNIGELTNVDSAADEVLDEDYVLVKYADSDKFAMKRLAEIMTPIVGLQRYVALQNNMTSKSIAVSKGDKCILDFTFISLERYSSADKYQNTDERGLLEVSILNSANAEFTVVKQMYINSGESTKIDVSEYLTSNGNNIMLKCKGEVTEVSTAALVYSVTLTTLGISADNFQWWIPYSGDISIPFIISGNISKKIMLSVAGNGYRKSYEENIGTATYTETPYNYILARPATDGVYTVTAYISNLDETLVTKEISFLMMVVSSGSLEKYMVVNNVNTEIKNYNENQVLEYAVFDGDAATTDLKITIELDGKQIYVSNEDAAPTLTRNKFSYQTEIEYSSNANFTVDLYIGDSNTANLINPITLKVDNSSSFAATSGSTFYMNPRTRSNSQSNRTMIVNESDGSEISATWVNFNWGNDAWLEDDSGNKVLRVMSKEKLTIDYYPFKVEAARRGKTIEIDYLSDNVVDYSYPIILMCSDDGTGLKITPDNICLLSQSLKNTVTLATNTDTGKRIRLTMVIMPTAYGNADLNLAILYINGKKNREFTYANNDYFAQSSPIVIGSEFADIDLYGIRMYDNALTSQQVLKNYINWLTDNAEKEKVRDANDVLDTNGIEVDYDNTIDLYNILVFDNDLPSYLDPNKKTGTLYVYFYEHPERNVSITNCSASGLGTSSKKYFRWNTKYKLDKTSSVITYADGTTGTKKWLMVEGIPAAASFTAKKNFASSMQSHKMGSVNSVDALYKLMGFTNEAMLNSKYSDARVAVYQMPFVMFTKSVNDEGNTIYTFCGEYTFGPDKGDKYTFGYDTDIFPRLISIEGSDNSPLCSLFRVPWSNLMQYNEDEEAFQYNGLNSWDFDGGDIANIDLWIPAYNLAYECSNRILPFEGTLNELNADINTYRSSGYDYWIAKAGDVNQYKVFYYEPSVGQFIGADVGNGTIHLPTLLAAYLDTSNLSSMTNSQKNELFINARIAKFRNEAPNYWDIDDAIFHRNWIEVHAGTDQRAKNTYPYCFGDGCKWKWRFDDMDTIFDTDNQGLPLKKYSVEVTDPDVWNGLTSNFWNLIDLAYPEEIKVGMTNFLNAMEELGGLNVGDDYGKLFAYFKKYYLDSSLYFPAAIVNADAKYCYETAKLNSQYVNDTDPMTQSLGDHYSAESAWISKRINYIMSKYSYGNFSAHGNDTIIVRAAGDLINYQLTPAIDLYPNIANGTSIVRGDRTFAGNTTVMTIDLGGSADQLNIILGASWYSSIGDWHDKNVKGTMTILGKRLLELILGSKTDTITISIDALEVKNTCKSLQKILLSNISTLKGNLDLSSCTHLREIYADGTALSLIILPKGSLELIEYPDTSQYLALQNYPLLKYQNVDLGNSSPNITDLIITACPLMLPIKVLSGIVEAQTSLGSSHSLKRIRLTDFDEVYDSKEGTKLLDNLAKISDGSYVGLDSNGIQIEGSYPVLDGTITINGNYYQDAVDALRAKFNKLSLIMNGLPAIRFVDDEVLRVLCEVPCFADYPNASTGSLRVLDVDGDRMIIEDEVSNVLCLSNRADRNNSIFNGNTVIRRFPEFKYFTGLTMINNGAFTNCTSLEEIELPVVEKMGGSIFAGCTSLKKLIIPEGYKTIGSGILNGATSCKLLDIPSTVTAIDQHIIWGVKDVMNIICRAIVPPTLNSSLGYNGIPKAIYVPDISVNAYKAADVWKNYSQYIKPLSEYVEEV